ARGLVLGLFEQVTDARRADADEHLDELGAGQGEEGHVRLARDGSRQQGLARARGTHQQHALGNTAAEPLVLPRILEEVDDLDELGLASSTPATSPNVVLSSLRSKILCLERPKESACVGPPPTRRIRTIQMAIMTPRGMIQPKKRSRTKVDSILPVNSTLCRSSSAMSGASSTPGMRVTVNTRTSASEVSHWRSRSPAPLGPVGSASGFAMPRLS